MELYRMTLVTDGRRVIRLGHMTTVLFRLSLPIVLVTNIQAPICASCTVWPSLVDVYCVRFLMSEVDHCLRAQHKDSFNYCIVHDQYIRLSPSQRNRTDTRRKSERERITIVVCSSLCSRSHSLWRWKKIDQYSIDLYFCSMNVDRDNQ